MTSVSELVRALRAEEPMGMLSGCCDTVKPRNPDGPAAADLIEAQAAEIARKDAALEQIAGSNALDMNSLHPDHCSIVARAALANTPAQQEESHG